jgi:protein gp37
VAENSKIEWTNHTFNPWSGCVKVSEACANCYAANLPPAMRRHAEWGADTPRIPASEAYWKGPLAWNKAAEKAGVRARVFCASVADVFEDRADLDVWRERLWALIAETPWLDWLLLTKRPHVMARWAEAHPWPVNAWAGATVENQKRTERIDDLRKVPARVRFLSMEPLGGPVALDLHGIHWVIVGGESGHRAKPMHPAWARSLRDQCVAAGVAFHFKQWGEWAPIEAPAGGGPQGWGWSDGSGRGAIKQDGHGRPEMHRWKDGLGSHARVGKVEAGRGLDGRTWDEFPR